MKLMRPGQLFLLLDTLKLILLLVLAGLTLHYFSLATQSLVEAKKSAQAANATTLQLKAFTKGVAGAVKSLKEDNSQQTLILCKLILNNKNLDPVDAVQIEAICKEKIKQANESSPNQASSGSNALQQEPKAPSSGSSSPQQSAPSNTSAQGDKPPQESDNDGVIIDLPILPPIHIGSPL